jgi:hypothetical protein
VFETEEKTDRPFVEARDHHQRVVATEEASLEKFQRTRGPVHLTVQLGDGNQVMRTYDINLCGCHTICDPS